MPIRGRSLGEVSRLFVDHLNTVLHRTVTQMPLSLEIAGTMANVRFRRGLETAPAVITTCYGAMDLYIGQLCGAVVDERGEYTLHTTSYRYALLPEGRTEPLLRWEYVRTPASDAQYCRHHVQGPIPLDLSDRAGQQANLMHWHLPTGWVTIEEVLRFCIVDLEVVPLDPQWDGILRDSYERFKTEFATLGEV